MKCISASGIDFSIEREQVQHSTNNSILSTNIILELGRIYYLKCKKATVSCCLFPAVKEGFEPMSNTLNIFYLQPKQKADNRIGHAVSIASRNRVKVREIVVHIHPRSLFSAPN